VRNGQHCGKRAVSLVQCPAQLVLRNQTSLYAKIDIFFPLHGKGITAEAQSETNVK
jgi:hypothetical protein